MNVHSMAAHPTSSPKPPIPDARAARLERRKAQIVAAATKLFGRQGYFGTTMQEVADEAGISVGLIYRYAPSKEELLLLTIGEILDLYGRELPRRIAAFEDPVERLVAGFTAYCEVLAARREAAMLAYHEARAVGPAGRERLKAKEVRTNRILGAEIEAGIQSGVLLDVDPDLIAYNLALLAHGWALKHWFLGPRQTLQQYIAFELGLILRSIIRPERMSDYCHLIGGGQ